MNEPIQNNTVADDEIDLWDLVATLIDARWLIIGVTIAAGVLGVAYALLTTPVYRADALLQIEQDASPFAGLGELSQAMTGEAPVAGEIEIIRSRSVIGGAISALDLQTVVTPHRLPIVGGFLARRHSGDEPSSLMGYALGGERVGLTRLSLSESLMGEPLTLEARDGGRYRLLGPKGERLLEGDVGKAASGNGVEAFVDELHAKPGTKFEVVRRNLPKAYEQVRTSLRVSEKGRQTGILELTYESTDAQGAADVLNAVISEFVRQNVERRSEEASQTLTFINQQLPELKSNLDAAEARLNTFRTARGTVDLSLETRGVLEQVAAVEARLSEFELQRAELRQRYTVSHPTVTALNEQIAQLQAEQTRLNGLIRGLPEAERESVSILRDVRVANELYMLLLNRAQELRVVEAGTVGNARIVDAAIRPVEPVKPRKPLVVLLSLMLGGILGVMLAFGRRAFSRGVEDPDQVERELGIPVYAVIPHSERQDELAGEIEANELDGIERTLATVAPTDLSIEAIRSLRTALQFGMLDAPNNIIAIGGPTEGVGKSFVAANLAAVLADAGKRVLLIDCDMRRGHMHRYFGVGRERGLSEIIGGGLKFDDVVHAGVRDGVDFLSTGVLPPNPSELLLHGRFRELMAQVAAAYDAVIVDVPPVLAVTDGAIVARSAGSNFLVLRYGSHTLREVAVAIKRLEQGGVRVQGIVMNGVTKRAGALGYRKYGYQYAYAYGE